MRRTILCSQIAASHDALERAMDDKATLTLVDDFTLKSNPTARAKALSRLKTAFATATFEWATPPSTKPPLICFSYWKPRNAADWTDDDDHPRDRQRVLVCNFLVAGRLPTGSRLTTGRYSLEITYHALARLVCPERSPLASTPLQLLTIAHKTLLRLSTDAVFRQKDNFVIDCGDEGGFVCEATPAVADGFETLFVTARTWLSPEMLSNHPVIPIARDRDDALGSYWLMPPPLRLRDDGETVHVPAAAIAAFAQ
jgi:hypothetical protein